MSAKTKPARQARQLRNQLVQAGVLVVPTTTDLTQLELRRGNRAQPIPGRKPANRGGRQGERQRWERDCA